MEISSNPEKDIIRSFITLQIGRLQEKERARVYFCATKAINYNINIAIMCAV